MTTLTVDELAEEILKQDADVVALNAHNLTIARELAVSILPFIQSHIAAVTQEPRRDASYPVGFQLDSGRTAAFLATPKDVGAVPLPKTEHEEEDGAGGIVGWYTGMQLIEYGDAREAAARVQQSEPAGSEALANEIIALAKEREDGYKARLHGDVLNHRIADKLVAIAARLTGAQADA
mgnify:CR=1 FL=1